VLDHLPISMIEKTHTLARYMAISAPEQMDLVRISNQQTLSFVSPIVTILQHKSAIISPVTLMILILCFMRETGDLLFAPL